MKLYHGSTKETVIYDTEKPFIIDATQNSRYGFPALFFTISKELAKNYAVNRCYLDGWHQSGKDRTVLSEFEVEIEAIQELDFNNNSTYSTEFVEHIKDFYTKNSKGVAFQNIYDSPRRKWFKEINTTIFVIYDFSLIKSFKIIEKRFI